MFDKIRTYFSDSQHKKLLLLFVILAITAAIPATAFIAQQQQTYRQHASRGDTPSPTPIANQLSIAKDAEAISQLTNQLLQSSKSTTALGPESLSQASQQRKIQIIKDAIEIAKKRKDLLLQLAEKNPRLFLALALKKNTQPTLPPEVQAYTEKEVTVEGTTEVLHVDDFKNPVNSKFSYFLKIGNERISLFPTQEIPIASGARVRAKGIQLDNTIVATTDKASFQVLQPAPQPESVGDQKTLVILLRFQDSGPPPLSKEAVYDLVFNGQTQKFYKEQSYNQVSFSGDIFGWFTLNYNNPIDACALLGRTDELSKLVDDKLIDLGIYSRVIFVADGYAGGCSSVGKNYFTINNKTYLLSHAAMGIEGYNTPSRYHPFQWTTFDYVLSHELGHSLGVWHANGWDCKNQTLYGECTHREYGNYFDTMGWDEFSLHFNAFYKELLGWINPSSALLINTSGTYTINPLESDSPTKLAKIKIQGFDLIPLYLEYRKGIGFDAYLNDTSLLSNQSGLFVNRIRKYPWSGSYTHLLDMAPTSQDWYEDMKQTTLNGGNIFTDPGLGITLGPIVKADNSSIAFDVKLTNPICTPHQPSISNPDYPESIAAGSQVYIGIEFFNKDSDGCGDSEFRIVPILPSGWNYDLYPPENISAAPDQRVFASINLRVPENTSIGSILLGFDIINIKSGLKVHKEFNILVKPAIKITKIDPEKGPVGTKITIFGSGFDQTASKNNITFYSYRSEGSYYYTENVSEISQIQGQQVIKFTIPDTICFYGSGVGAPIVQGGDGSCSNKIPTPLGFYSIYVYEGLSSSSFVSFEVALPPTLTPSLCTPCSTDLNKDGIVNKADADLASACFGKTGTGSCSSSDIDKNGIVNVHDIACVGSQNGKTCTANVTPTPTPSACTACGADIDKSGTVDRLDLNGVLACSGKATTGGCSVADAKKDGFINVHDVTCVIGNLNKPCSSNASPAKK